MSNGEGGCGKALEHNYHSKKNSVNEEFVQAIAKEAVAQVCESSRFQQSALDTLSDIVVRYISHIGKIANWNANLYGRAECNVLDIIQGLEDLGMSQGFSGASGTNCCPTGLFGILLSMFIWLRESHLHTPFPVFYLLNSGTRHLALFKLENHHQVNTYPCGCLHFLIPRLLHAFLRGVIEEEIEGWIQSTRLKSIVRWKD